jgi:hypothetical protein
VAPSSACPRSRWPTATPSPASSARISRSARSRGRAGGRRGSFPGRGSASKAASRSPRCPRTAPPGGGSPARCRGASAPRRRAIAVSPSRTRSGCPAAGCCSIPQVPGARPRRGCGRRTGSGHPSSRRPATTGRTARVSPRSPARARRLGLPLVASGEPLMHHGGRRRVVDVLTCIREGITIDRIGRAALANAERRLRPEAEMLRLFRGHEDAVHRAGAVAAPAPSRSTNSPTSIPARSGTARTRRTGSPA